ncbi:MAG: hypothetical protein ABSB32_21565 [Thermodesulfobacteriota bacterium]|jgi:hypothetical protein
MTLQFKSDLKPVDFLKVGPGAEFLKVFTGPQEKDLTPALTVRRKPLGLTVILGL